MAEDFRILEQEDESAEINIGPLIDMVFILLIFFVITTNFTRQTGIDVTKPKAQTAVSQGQKVILVGISREGTIHAYGRQMSPERLQALIQEEVLKRPDLSVVIVSDRQAEIGKAVEVMDICSLAGAKKVSISAEKSR